ncbi:hypothetical protein Ahy_A10g048085 isoform A [Arachis hypogaea]|uniref:Uncharacterized protein n=1 Tax=Arachis hypogaea TaxID=3818 RepID=A0A445B4D9_ARAHY|nr:hypothetical protein Ahy_A10g048085 isoform A [Arachis hypogaea]
MAKQKAIAQIYGDWEEPYNKVLKLLQALQSYFSETICELRSRSRVGRKVPSFPQPYLVYTVNEINFK